MDFKSWMSVATTFRNEPLDSTKVKIQMPGSSKSDASEQQFKCPDCRYPLKRRRSRRVDECEMVCGGCGQSFDICDLDTVDKLKDQSE